MSFVSNDIFIKIKLLELISFRFSLSLLILLNFCINVNAKSTKSKISSENSIEKGKNEVEKLILIPRLKLTEKNSLKSYLWWEDKKPKIPQLYKPLLKKMSDDFLLENYDISFLIKVLTKDNMIDHNGHYVLFGNLIVDSKNKKFNELIDVSIYKIENGVLNLIQISTVESYNINSSFRILASTIKEKLNNKSEPANVTKVDYLNIKEDHNYYIIFENELSFDELEQIRLAIKEALNIKLENISLLFSETKKYTYLLKSYKNPWPILQNQVFVNGPYEARLDEKSIIFKSLPIEDTTDDDF